MPKFEVKTSTDSFIKPDWYLFADYSLSKTFRLFNFNQQKEICHSVTKNKFQNYDKNIYAINALIILATNFY